MTLMPRVLLTSFAALLVVLGFPQIAGAHPLGNFTVNRYARVEPSAGIIRVTYVLDEAEIPTFQEQKAIDANRDGWAQTKASEIAENLKLTVDGQLLSLQRKDYLLSQPEGQGGLPVTRLAVIYEAPAPAGTDLHNATFADLNETDRIGWREIIVKQQGDSRIENSTAPSTDSTDELRKYPANLIQAPLDLRQASFRFDAGTIAIPAEHLVSPTSAPTRADSGFSGLVRTVDPGPVAIVLLFLLALGFGAVHALSPGHGKSVMAAYLVGTRGRPVDAVLLGVLVSIMHTGSVLVVGLVLLKVGSETDIAKVYPVLTLLSGLIVVALGTTLLAVRTRGVLKARRQDREHTHSHDNHSHHEHEHEHEHEHDIHEHIDLAHDHHHHQHTEVHEPALAHAHSHVIEEHVGHSHEDQHTHTQDHPHPDEHAPDHDRADNGVHSHGFGSHSHAMPEGVAPLSRRGLVVLATSGGLLPSPSAVIVLIGAASTGRLAFGLGLIAAFSVGLAATLTAVGLALVYGRNFLERRESSTAAIVLRLLPVASALALLVAGTVVTIDGLNQL